MTTGRSRRSRRGRRGRAQAIAAAAALGAAALAGCGGATPPDTVPVLLTEGTTGGEAWRLEGWRAEGQPCVALVAQDADRPMAERCGIWRTPQRHLNPVVAGLGDRILVFSALAADARRVRLDGNDGSIRVETAQSAAGFADRFFVVDLAVDNRPVAVRVFGDGGRAVVT